MYHCVQCQGGVPEFPPLAESPPAKCRPLPTSLLTVGAYGQGRDFGDSWRQSEVLALPTRLLSGRERYPFRTVDTSLLFCRGRTTLPVHKIVDFLFELPYNHYCSKAQQRRPHEGLFCLSGLCVLRHKTYLLLYRMCLKSARVYLNSRLCYNKLKQKYTCGGCKFQWINQ